MSSSKKTSNLKLNQWLETDIPERMDFVSDNDIIDKKIGKHVTDQNIHVTSFEKEQWNQFYYKFSYIGDDESTKTIETGCPFDPTWGIIMATTLPPSVVDIANNSNYNYFGIFTDTGSNSGLSIVDGNNLRVYQSSSPVQRHEYRNYNQDGIVYNVIMFR